MTTTILRPEEIEQSNSRDILVTTIESTQVSFKGGAYAVIRADTLQCIRGEGTLTSKSTEAEPTSFSGD